MRRLILRSVGSRLFVVGFISLYVGIVPVIAQEVPDPEITPDVANPVVPIINAAFSTGNGTPMVGEPYVLRFTLDYPDTVTIVELPDLSQFPSPFEVLSLSPIVEEMGDDGIVGVEQTVELVVWQTGDLTTPEFFIAYTRNETAPDETLRIPVREAFFAVESILETDDLNELELRPNTPPASLLYIPPWLILLLCLVLIVVLIMTYRWWEQRRRRLLLAQPVIAPETPYETAHRHLYSLSRQVDDVAYDVVLASIAKILKSYIAATFAMDTLDKTTRELVAALGESDHLTQTQSDSLWTLLERVDLAAYAGYKSDQSDAKRVVSLANRWLQSVDSAGMPPVTHDEVTV